MQRRLPLILGPILAFGLQPARAETPNLAIEVDAALGSATQLVLAQRVYRQATLSGDPVLLLAAIRLARGVMIRPATAWERMTDDDATPPETTERTGPPDPGSAAALTVLQGLAVDDPDLQDLAYDLDAQLPQGRLPVATVAAAAISGGARDDWRLPLSGAVAAEIAVIGDGSTPLGLTVTDDTGAIVCARPATTDPMLCSFVPARNGFFTVAVSNSGSEWNNYRLIGN